MGHKEIKVWDVICGCSLRVQTPWEDAKDLIRYIPESHPYMSIRNDLQSIIDAGDVDIADQEDHDSIDSAIEEMQELRPGYTFLDWRNCELMCVPDVEIVVYEIESGECLKVEGLSDVPNGYLGLVAIVNDHGNMTFGHYDPAIGFAEYWSIV